jgi:hypothetical protein
VCCVFPSVHLRFSVVLVDTQMFCHAVEAGKFVSRIFRSHYWYLPSSPQPLVTANGIVIYAGQALHRSR